MSFKHHTTYAAIAFCFVTHATLSAQTTPGYTSANASAERTLEASTIARPDPARARALFYECKKCAAAIPYVAAKMPYCPATPAKTSRVCSALSR